MRQIGQTELGALIVEMTSVEWAMTQRQFCSDEVAKKPQDKNKWYQRFKIDLQHLNLETRAYNALMRCVYDYGQPGTDESLFSTNGRYLDFEDWVLVARDRKTTLLNVRNLGTSLTNDILAAVERYLQEATT